MLFLTWVTRSSFTSLLMGPFAVDDGLTLVKQRIKFPNRLLIFWFDLSNAHSHGRCVSECFPIPQRGVKECKGTGFSKQFARVEVVRPA